MIMEKRNVESHPDINVNEILEGGFLVQQEDFAEGVDDIVKSLFMDAILSMIAGYHSIPESEIHTMMEIAEEEDASVRALLPAGKKMSRHMAAFINGYSIRFADLCDTQRQAVGRGGHTADMIAGLISVADDPRVTGKKILEAINFGYHLWADLQHKMLCKVPNLDGVTGLALVMPFLIGISRGDDPETIANALYVTSNGGLFAVETRSSGVVTNMKSAATGLALARAVWYYRMSAFLRNTPTMFTGIKGWSKMVAPLDCELSVPSTDYVYNHIQLKTHPCCNVNQAAVDCAGILYEKVRNRLDDIEKIIIHVSKKDSILAIKPSQPKYPTDHPSADHHIRFCTAITLLYGALYPEHYDEKYLNDPQVRGLIDLMDTVIIPDEEFEAMGAEAGCGILEIFFKDGSAEKQILLKPEGIMSGAKCPEIGEKMKKLVADKQKMIEDSFGYDLTAVRDVIYSTEKYSGIEIMDALESAMKK